MAETDMSKLYENLPDNSHKSRNEKKAVENNKVEKRAEKVVHGKVKTKTNNARKLTDIFISEDVSNVKNYIIMDVIVPSIKKAVYDLIVGTLDMSLYGGRGGGKRPTADKISYRDYSNASRRDERSYGSTRTASGYSYDDIVVETRGEAESVLARMDEIMEEYEQVRVADLYDLVGISGDYTDNKYGWTNIRNARVVRTRDGYKIEMPRAIARK
jgi:hypothetical protein